MHDGIRPAAGRRIPARTARPTLRLEGLHRPGPKGILLRRHFVSHAGRHRVWAVVAEARFCPFRVEFFDHLDDFGAMEDLEPTQEQFNRPITEVMEEPVSVEDDSGLVRAFSFIIKHDLLDLPIVDRNGQIVGIASRVDIGRALLPVWCEGVLNNIA